jgi:gentisate 1,2-dioxygenase
VKALSSAALLNSDRARFSQEIAALNMKPLWERVMRLKPGTAAVPAIWRWEEVRPLLMHACEVITAKEAERRVLMLENPALAGTTFITTTLYAGLQAILPGEIAPTHRHTPNALRFVMEGEGAYTAIDGERIAMRPGDFVVTPGWTWHDHGNLGAKPVVWLDGLDIAFANIMGAHFREDYPEESQRLSKPDGDSAARYGASLLPVGSLPQGHASPMLSYPYERTRAALEQLSKDGAPHPSHGWKLRYANPATGGHAFPTMAVFMQWLPRGFAGGEYRSTDATIFCVVEGQGSVAIGETHFEFAPKDVFVVPSWEPYRFEARSDCVIFSYSDRAAQEALGFWREET